MGDFITIPGVGNVLTNPNINQMQSLNGSNLFPLKGDGSPDLSKFSIPANAMNAIVIEPPTVDIKYLADITPLEMIKQGDWIDLRVSEDIDMKKDDFKLLPLGIAVKLPEGYEAFVAPRSSTFMKYGIIQTNSIGIIDESYCGDDDQWMFPALAMRDTHIDKDTRIAQFRILPHSPAWMTLKTVKSLDKQSRGGFGSTGEK